MKRFLIFEVILGILCLPCQAIPQFSISHQDVIGVTYLMQCFEKVREIQNKGDAYVSFLSHQPLGEMGRTPPDPQLILTFKRKATGETTVGNEPLITFVSTEHNVKNGKRLENRYDCGDVKEDRP